MVQLFGRITKDATVRELSDEKKVVNFSIAINDYYKPKDGEPVKLVTYVNCAYWLNASHASLFTKGTLIEVGGRLSVSAYNNMQGEAVGTLNFHVNNFKLYGGKNQPAPPTGENTAQRPAKKRTPKKAEEVTEPIEDLPF